MQESQYDKITTVTANRAWLNINLKEIWEYRDLALLFVKRDLVNAYKQTVLGPIWIIINPLLSTIVFTVIFGVIAGIGTDGVPQFLFYMSGNTLWSFFSNCLNRASSTFLGNARIFGKVYFPRLIMPVSGILYNLVNFMLQTGVFVILVIIYTVCGANVHPNWFIALTPLLILQTALLGTAMGLIISSITTKYRDLNILVSFGVSLLMYITPVVYPISKVPEDFRWLMLLNPVAPIVESYRYAFMGSGSIEWFYLLLSMAVTAVLLFLGILVFNRVEKNFIDTV
ncbi:MAG: ABC transporter permease [Ruminococcus sp.]|nr:ABC transporter permease [Ruminococcus sp.]